MENAQEAYYKDDLERDYKLVICYLDDRRLEIDIKTRAYFDICWENDIQRLGLLKDPFSNDPIDPDWIVSNEKEFDVPAIEDDEMYFHLIKFHPDYCPKLI